MPRAARGPGPPGRSRRVTVYPSRDEHDEHPVAARDRPLYDLAVVGRAGHDVDPTLEVGEFADAPRAAHADHLVPAVQCVLDHVLPELPGRTDDADSHATRSPPGALANPLSSRRVGRVAFRRCGPHPSGIHRAPASTLGASQSKPGARYRLEAEATAPSAFACRASRPVGQPLSQPGAGDSARSDVPAGRRSALGALSAWLLPPRGLGRTSRRTGDLAARTYRPRPRRRSTPFG